MIKTQLKNTLLILALVVPAFLISCNKDEDVKLDFEITVPETWTSVILANEGNIYVAGRNQINEDDTIREGMLIYKEKLPNWTLDQYYSAIRNNIVNSDYYIGTVYQSDTVINNTDFIKLISREYIPFINTAYNDTIDISSIVEHYFFFENSNGYNIVFNSIDSLYTENREVFGDIMSSFSYNY